MGMVCLQSRPSRSAPQSSCRVRGWRKHIHTVFDGPFSPQPDTQLHVILDNLNTHKPKYDRWLARHPNVTFHFTPTRASWLNQIEIWFSILFRQALRGGSFTSARQLRGAIDAFIQAHNEKAAPFEWTKCEVHPTPPKRYYADSAK